MHANRSLYGQQTTGDALGIETAPVLLTGPNDTPAVVT
jgi:hypothetical protein